MSDQLPAPPKRFLARVQGHTFKVDSRLYTSDDIDQVDGRSLLVMRYADGRIEAYTHDGYTLVKPREVTPAKEPS